MYKILSSDWLYDQETLDELQNRSMNRSGAGGDGGWEVEEEGGWEVEDIDNIKEVARLRVENKKNREMKEMLEKQLVELRVELETTAGDMETFKTEAVIMREARDEVVKDHADLERR